MDSHHSHGGSYRRDTGGNDLDGSPGWLVKIPVGVIQRILPHLLTIALVSWAFAFGMWIGLARNPGRIILDGIQETMQESRDAYREAYDRGEINNLQRTDGDLSGAM